MSKNIKSKVLKKLVIIGENFISASLFDDYKRYGKVKLSGVKNAKKIIGEVDYIIDCSFNENVQNLSIDYCKKNDNEKLLIVNHWEKKKIPKMKTIVLQSIIYDVYGEEHNSFYRAGPGNNYDNNINYCTFIAESIRRVHEAKFEPVPNVYLPYGENKIKFIHIDNIYDPINYMLTTLKTNSSYSIYDEERYANSILSTIKGVIDYEGNIIFEYDKSSFTQHIKGLDYNRRKNSFEYSIKRIYRHLLCSNERFII